MTSDTGHSAVFSTHYLDSILLCPIFRFPPHSISLLYYFCFHFSFCFFEFCLHFFASVPLFSLFSHCNVRTYVNLVLGKMLREVGYFFLCLILACYMIQHVPHSVTILMCLYIWSANILPDSVWNSTNVCRTNERKTAFTKSTSIRLFRSPGFLNASTTDIWE